MARERAQICSKCWGHLVSSRITRIGSRASTKQITLCVSKDTTWRNMPKAVSGYVKD